MWLLGKSLRCRHSPGRCYRLGTTANGQQAGNVLQCNRHRQAYQRAGNSRALLVNIDPTGSQVDLDARPNEFRLGALEKFLGFNKKNGEP